MLAHQSDRTWVPRSRWASGTGGQGTCVPLENGSINNLRCQEFVAGRRERFCWQSQQPDVCDLVNPKYTEVGPSGLPEEEMFLDPDNYVLGSWFAN